MNNSVQNEDTGNANESIEVTESIEVNDKDEPENNWIIRIEMDERAMFDMNIMNEDIHYILKSTHQDNVSCFYSDYNDEGKIVFRIRPKYNIGKKKETNSFTQEDYVYYVKKY